MASFLIVIIVMFMSYLVGSIPTAVWAGKLTLGIDIREYGSGNAGATNSFRILGWKAGVLVSLVDIGKGFVAAFYISQLAFVFDLMPDDVGIWNIEVLVKILAGMGAVIGHIYPIFAGFKGGKGAITAAGVLYGLEPLSITLALLVFLIVLFTTRYASMASMLSSVSYPIILISLGYFCGLDGIDKSLMVFSLMVPLFIISKHTSNIKRLREGTENRIQSFSPSKGV
ncbi:MAG: glycerol-3-phosphate 1-O-acyltransferase PlsY [Balneolales bacterium]|nr:glycerol-3-phosphate 1-O-acyltransferase PlsY [Balneolales bacterium]